VKNRGRSQCLYVSKAGDQTRKIYYKTKSGIVE
jgi:hypothetical protein